MKKLILPHSIVLLALLVFVAFPSSSALAAPKCDPVVFSQNSPGVPINVFMTSITPSPYIIFYTVDGVSAPTHSGSTPGANTYIYTTSVPVGPNQTIYFRALTYKASPYVDSIITDYKVFNPGDLVVE